MIRIVRPRATFSKHLVQFQDRQYVVMFQQTKGFWDGKVGVFAKGKDLQEVLDFGDVKEPHPSEQTAESLVLLYLQQKAKDQ